MVFRRRVARARRGRPKRKIVRRRVARRSNTMNALKDKARVVEVYSSNALTGNTGYIQNFNLSEFNRASAVAKNYRYYRATKVELEFIPYANVYSPGQSFPELYYQMDHTAFIVPQAPLTSAVMEQRGVLPMKFTSIIKKKYTPAVLRYEQLLVRTWKDANEFYINDLQPLTATPVKNKWYMTQNAYTPLNYVPNQTTTTEPIGPAADPTKLVYTGSAFFLNTPVAQTGDIGRVVIKVHWEFKQPLVASSSNNAVPPTIENV